MSTRRGHNGDTHLLVCPDLLEDSPISEETVPPKRVSTQLQRAFGLKSVHINHSDGVVPLAEGKVQQLAL